MAVTFELLASRGHALKDLLIEYPISTVRELAKAAAVNRLYDAMANTNQIAVGAVHAIEAGFSGKTPKALRKYLDALQRQIKQTQVKGTNDQERDANELMSGFGMVAPKETRGVRRKDNPRGHN